METNHLDSDSHLPPRKRLLAGFNKLNSNGNRSSSSSSSSSSSTSDGSSSHVHTHLDNLLASRYNIDYNQSPEELVEATRSAAALAVNTAKAAREIANEKAFISAKAIAVAKRALELVDSFPKESMADCKESSPKKNKQKKHVPLQHLYSKENGQINKKQKKTVVEDRSRVAGFVNDVAVVVDSDSSYDGLESNLKAFKVFKPDEVDSIPTPGKEVGDSLGRRRGRVKLKKLPLSICNSKDQENGASSASPLPVAQLLDEGVVSWKCQDLKGPECVKQNKAVQS